MTRWIGLEDIGGTKAIFVDPAKVTRVESDPSSGGSLVVFDNKDSVFVKGKADEVLRKFNATRA